MADTKSFSFEDLRVDIIESKTSLIISPDSVITVNQTCKSLAEEVPDNIFGIPIFDEYL